MSAKPALETRTAPAASVRERPPVLLVGNFLSASGGSRGVCEDLAERLAGGGWSVLATSSAPNRARRLAQMIETVWRHRNDYEVAQVDVFSGRAFVWAEAVCGALALARKPYLLVLHGGDLPRFARRWPRRVRRLLGSAAAVLAPSEYLLDRMRPYRDDILPLANPLELGRYPFRRRATPRPSLVWLRAFHAIYNPCLVPKVVARLAGEFPGVRATMIGPDKGDGSLARVRECAAALGVADRIALPGAVPKARVGEWLDRGDVFLNTSNVDNTPVSVLEAMACGLCVVSTDVGGIPYLLDEGRTALLVPPDDACEMAAAVRRVLVEGGLAARLSEGARTRTADLDWSVYLPLWERLVRDAASAGRGGARS